MTVRRGFIQTETELQSGSRLRTEHLDIIPSTPQLAETEQNHPAAQLGHLLEALVPDNWPPPIVEDRNSTDGAGWWDWYIIKHEPEGAILIGILGLKGWPSVSRTVRVGCGLLPEFQDHGYGTEAVDAIASWALEQPHIDRVIADTPTDNYLAVGVLRKLGFAPIESDDPDLMRFEKSRASFADYRATGG